MLRNSFAKIKEDMSYLQKELTIIRQEIAEIKQILHSSTYATEVRHPAHNPAHNMPNYDLKPQNFHSSIGNDGVPADRQQTDNRQINTLKRTSEPISKSDISSFINTLKQDLKEKFKQLTKKEFVIFSILYTLEEEKENVNYKDIALRTGLTESSVRDYIARLIHKGIPIIKEKINNKIIILRLPRELKDITTLSSLTKLKNLE